MDLTVDQILSFDINQAWSAYTVYKEEDPDPERYNKIRFGENIIFDINRLINNGFTEKEKKGIIIIKGKTYPEEYVYTEIENRTTLMKTALLDMIPDGKVTQERE